MANQKKAAPRVAPAEGSHAHDILVTGNLLAEAREKGMISIANTVDGNIFVFYRVSSRLYDVSQELPDGTFIFVNAKRHDIQKYLIDLRERRRKQEREQKRMARQQKEG